MSSTNGSSVERPPKPARRPPRSLADSGIPRDGLTPGTRAPDVSLPLAGGGTLTLDDYRGSRVLLVFSDPECGPCNELVPQLERAHRESSDPRIVMISRTAAKTRATIAAHGLTFPVALQRRWEVSREWAMFSLPNAYLVDDAGMIAAPAAVGREAILALVGGREADLRLQVAQRLSGLQQELERGEAALARIDRQRADLRDTLLRIAGAIQVLGELEASVTPAVSGDALATAG